MILQAIVPLIYRFTELKSNLDFHKYCILQEGTFPGKILMTGSENFNGCDSVSFLVSSIDTVNWNQKKKKQVQTYDSLLQNLYALCFG